MLARHVVEDEVEDEADAGVVEVLGEGLEVVHRPEVGAHRAVVGHGVAAVVVALARAQEGHEVEVADPELAQVGQPLGHPAQVAGEALGVGGVPDEAGVLEPVGPQHPVEVAAVQPVGACRVGGVRELHEVGGEAGRALAAVEEGESGDEVGEPALDTGLEHRGAVDAGRRGGHHRIVAEVRNRFHTLMDASHRENRDRTGNDRTVGP